MPYAIDLNPRQSARTIEQAVRHHAQIELQPRVWPDGEALFCRIEAVEAKRAGSRCLGLISLSCHRQPESTDGEPQPPDQAVDKCTNLLGTYCDVILRLGDARYLFSSEIAEVSSSGPEEVRICIVRPELIQVAQRRRFWRFRPARSSQVELRWTRDDQGISGGVAWLCNVSAEGLACRADMRISDQVCIGDQVKVNFTLTPGDPQHFSLDAAICNKMPGGSDDKLMLGLQFLTGPGFEESERNTETLRQQLLARYRAHADAIEGADA